MEPAHLSSGNRICTVVFVDIVQYSQQPVSEQVDMKARFNDLLGHALEHTPVADRVILDTGDGAALCFLGDPEDALFAANSLRSAMGTESGPFALRLRLGINLGPVRVVKDINGHTNIIGDGINVAQRVMSFSEPNQILVSRSYYEVVSRLSQEYAQLFQYAGLHRDKHVREHEVYEVHVSLSPGAGTAAGPVEDPSRSAEVTPGGAPAVVRPRFDPALLARLTTALVGELGPVSKLVVRRAAERAGDLDALVSALADSLPGARRPGFLAGLADLASAATPPRTGPAAAGVGPSGLRSDHAAGPAPKIGPEVLARAEQHLTRQIGPLARILVKNAARHATNPRELFETLAVHIDNAAARTAFLAEADRRG